MLKRKNFSAIRNIVELKFHFPFLGCDSERFDHGSADPDKGEETLGKGETGRKSPSWQSLRRQGLSQVWVKLWWKYQIILHVSRTLYKRLENQKDHEVRELSEEGFTFLAKRWYGHSKAQLQFLSTGLTFGEPKLQCTWGQGKGMDSMPLKFD